jgi:hypothetical protein
MPFAIAKYLNRVRPSWRWTQNQYLLCLHYALCWTHVHWIIRLADDILVNFVSRGKMISLLNSQHNPLREVVFKAYYLDGYHNAPKYG